MPDEETKLLLAKLDLPEAHRDGLWRHVRVSVNLLSVQKCKGYNCKLHVHGFIHQNLLGLVWTAASADLQCFCLLQIS